jgi:biopolymer transport protein ExbD
MAMSSGTKGMNSDINVTPMIDVLLVLLIIFMVIVPAVPRGEKTSVPQPAKTHGPSDPDPGAVVLEVLKGSSGAAAFKINQQLVSKADLPGKLASIFADRAERVLFLKGDDQLSFTQVAEAIDVSHAAGVEHVALMTPNVLAAQ